LDDAATGISNDQCYDHAIKEQSMPNDSKLTELIADYDAAVNFAGNSVRLAERGTVVNGELITDWWQTIPGALRAVEIKEQIRKYQPTSEAEFAEKLEFLCR
jgi:hypothetical protein